MNDPMLPLPGLSPVSGKSVVAKFDGGLLSSNGGVLALREVEKRLRVADRFAACIDDPRAPDQITHTLADIIRFRLLMIAAGYEDGNDASDLRRDPLFKMALDRAPSDRELCSQPTISRLENVPDGRSLLRMGRAMIDLYCASFRQVPKRIVLDIDDTFDAVHGGQQLRLFNAHSDEYGFQPIVLFDGEGRFVSAVLRPAKRPKGTEVRALLRRLLRAIRAGRRRRSCCVPTAIIAARRFSTGAAPTGSTSSSALRRPRPCAVIASAWKPARWRASSPPHRRARCAVIRSSTTAPPAGAGSSASSRASRPAPTEQTPASSSRACRPETLACSTKTFIAGAARRKITSRRGRRTWLPIARPAPKQPPTSSGCFCMPARIGCCGACAR